jgi:DNA mismatch repair protein MutL
MGNIKILDDHIANQIAAGEVVERPASVVKELIENALDATGSRIEIDIEEGGLSLIRVKDNGVGMEADDLYLAFSRHATSKIHTSKDLFHIRTLGFRGEALPSIAAVAKVTSHSATKDGEGTSLRIEGGKVIEQKAMSLPRGTEIIVQQLFYNTPARLKYMKSIQTEIGHVTDVIYRAALSRPDVAFVYRHEQRTILSTTGNGDLLQVIAAIYGTSVAKSMVRVSGENLDFQLYGYVSKPELTRSQRHSISWIVNQRSIRNPALFHSLMQSYHTLLPLHRYPIAVLMLQMDPILLDVNVHPAKLEVRLSKEQECCKFLQKIVSDALKQEVLIPRPHISEPRIQKQISHQQQMDLYKPVNQPNETRTMDPADSAGVPNLADRPISLNESKENYASDTSDSRFSNDRKSERKIPHFQSIGQVHGTYILAQSEEGLYIIDQHAAHERIYYERFLHKFNEPVRQSQDLIVPLMFEWTAKEQAQITEHLDRLKQVGVYMEGFGGNTFIVRSTPTWFPEEEERAIIEEMVDYLLIQKEPIPIGKWRESSAIMLSCKTAIKANKRLSKEETDELLVQLRECEQPFTCPHGRPIIIHFSTYDLEKMFKRVM